MYLHDYDEYYTLFHGSTGQPATVKVVVKMPENYPVDLYYLMDLSGSMVEDLKKFPALGESIGLQQLIAFYVYSSSHLPPTYLQYNHWLILNG